MMLIKWCVHLKGNEGENWVLAKSINKAIHNKCGTTGVYVFLSHNTQVAVKWRPNTYRKHFIRMAWHDCIEFQGLLKCFMTGWYWKVGNNSKSKTWFFCFPAILICQQTFISGISHALYVIYNKGQYVCMLLSTYSRIHYVISSYYGNTEPEKLDII